MKTDKVFIPVSASKRLPDTSDTYFTNNGRTTFEKESGVWHDFKENLKVFFWLEEKENVYLFTFDELENLIKEYRTGMGMASGINITEFLKSKFPTP